MSEEDETEAEAERKIRRIVRSELEHHEFQLGEETLKKLKEMVTPAPPEKKCADCGHTVKPSDKYCSDCGEEQLED